VYNLAGRKQVESVVKPSIPLKYTSKVEAGCPSTTSSVLNAIISPNSRSSISAKSGFPSLELAVILALSRSPLPLPYYCYICNLRVSFLAEINRISIFSQVEPPVSLGLGLFEGLEEQE
jgi:hypothetical protein